jgi:hypothetical protein
MNSPSLLEITSSLKTMAANAAAEKQAGRTATAVLSDTALQGMAVDFVQGVKANSSTADEVCRAGKDMLTLARDSLFWSVRSHLTHAGCVALQQVHRSEGTLLRPIDLCQNWVDCTNLFIGDCNNIAAQNAMDNAQPHWNSVVATGGLREPGSTGAMNATRLRFSMLSNTLTLLDPMAESEAHPVIKEAKDIVQVGHSGELDDVQKLASKCINHAKTASAFDTEAGHRTALEWLAHAFSLCNLADAKTKPMQCNILCMMASNHLAVDDKEKAILSISSLPLLLPRPHAPIHMRRKPVRSCSHS